MKEFNGELAHQRAKERNDRIRHSRRTSDLGVAGGEKPQPGKTMLRIKPQPQTMMLPTTQRP